MCTRASTLVQECTAAGGVSDWKDCFLSMDCLRMLVKSGARNNQSLPTGKLCVGGANNKIRAQKAQKAQNGQKTNKNVRFLLVTKLTKFQCKD